MEELKAGRKPAVPGKDEGPARDHHRRDACATFRSAWVGLRSVESL